MADTLAAPAPPAEPRKLDDLMLAMDVVDTLRHQDSLVARELDETRRDAELIERLRRLYQGQGIEVPDRVLVEGVRALKESRFAYTPPGPGLGTALARLWVARAKVGKGLMAGAAALGLGWGAYEFGIAAPERQRAEAARIEAERASLDLSQRLPRALEAGHAEVLAEARVPAARARADGILAAGRAALARRDAAGAEQAILDLEGLRADLRREYALRIVSRPGEPSIVFRIPDRIRGTRYAYVVVEAVAPDGRLVELPVTGEDDRATRNVSQWAVRVSEAVADEIRRDKNDDGILQRDRLGEKRRGSLEVEYFLPVLGGAITRW